MPCGDPEHDQRVWARGPLPHVLVASSPEVRRIVREGLVQGASVSRGQLELTLLTEAVDDGAVPQVIDLCHALAFTDDEVQERLRRLAEQEQDPEVLARLQGALD